jgi:uroporphyrinogen III methyltransferase / synthase
VGVSGRVYLVGAGPGDPGLLTARALALIADADVILYDRLIGAEALDGARAGAELLFVGKEGGGDAVPQEQTHELMIARANEGRTVVRLKGGDPFVFGRGGEEGLALRAAGIEFEVVPGVTAGIAALAYAGIPVTHRGLSSAVALVTAHARSEDGLDAATGGNAAAAAGPVEGDHGWPDWPALAAFPGTLVFYMGAARLAEISSSLISNGRSADEPAAVVQSGTLPAQQTLTGTLQTIAADAQDAGMGAPLLLVVGAVAALADELSWVSPRPLAGYTIAVTRARAQASELARRLELLGARVVQAPVIRTRVIEAEVPPLSAYDLVCLTSPNAVRALFERLAASGRDARALAGARVAAIGPGTATALAERGVLADVVPERPIAESLVEALAEGRVERALVARASKAREVLVEGLRARGAEVDVLALYETEPEPISERTLSRALAADYVTFTSSSTVTNFLSAASPRELSPHARVVSIGPATSETLLEHGIRVHVEASRHDIDGVVQALLEDAVAREREPRG